MEEALRPKREKAHNKVPERLHSKEKKNHQLIICDDCGNGLKVEGTIWSKKKCGLCGKIKLCRIVRKIGDKIVGKKKR